MSNKVRPAGLEDSPRSDAGIHKAAPPGISPSRSHRTKKREEEAWQSLDVDLSDVVLTRITLSFRDKCGNRLPELEQQFLFRNAIRYSRFVRVTTWAFLVANVLFVGYDWVRFKDKGDTLIHILAVRLGLIVPATLLLLYMTYHKSYAKNPNLLNWPSILVGAGLVVYSILGTDPGYGTLAVLIVYMYSFTPIGFFRCSVTSLLLIAAFWLSMLFVLADDDTKLSDAEKEEDRFNLVGVLLLFWSAVGFIGHMLEHSLRQSFLDEIRLWQQREALRHEEELVNNLLANMLPPSVSAELKRGRHLIADEFSVVTVLFCEIYHFADLTKGIAPELVVEILNSVYSEFDALVEPNHVYKVETVGEVYMVVGGCPEPHRHHAQRCAAMATAMIESMPRIRGSLRASLPQLGDLPDRLRIRVGLNSGPIVAGIVGIDNPRYKLFGDTVNTASRMESTCIPDRIQCTERTAALLKHSYELEARGGIEVKGKGVMETFFLGERHAVPRATPRDGEYEEPVKMRSKSGASHAGKGMPSKTHGNQRSGRALWAGVQATLAARAMFAPGSMPRDELSLAMARGQGDGSVQTVHPGDSAKVSPIQTIKSDDHRLDMPSKKRITVHEHESKAGPVGSFFVDEATKDAPGATRPSASVSGSHGDVVVRVESVESTHRSDSREEAIERELKSIANAPHAKSRGGHGRRKSFVETLATMDQTGSKKAAEYDAMMDTWKKVNADQAGDSLRLNPKPSGLRQEDGVLSTPQVIGASGESRVAQATPHKSSDPGFAPSDSRSPPSTAVQVAPRPRRRSASQAAKSCMPKFVTSFVPESGMRLVLFYREGNDRLSALEGMFQVEHAPGWRKFVQATAIVLVAVLAMFTLQDWFKYNDKGAEKEQTWSNIAIARYAVWTPLALIYLALTYTVKFRDNNTFARVLTGGLVFFGGCCIVAVSVLGKEPGYGVLALYIVYSLNVSLLPFAWRFAISAVLIPVYLVAVNIFNQDYMTVNNTAEHFSYLTVFLLGQGVPVLAREYYLRDNYHRQCKMQLQKRKLAAEQKRSNALLESMLPKPIAKQLKGGAVTIAGHFDEAAILFTDMRGFTKFSSTITPVELVSFLNNMYSKFDRISQKYGIYKVEIIGDAYFGVAGCPTKTEDHVERCANAAFEMLGLMGELRKVANSDINMRVGIHCGPLVAGVVGHMDPRYHLFGDTVSLAMAMESGGVPGRVHISDAAFAKLSSRMKAREHEFVRMKGSDEALVKGEGNGFFSFEPRSPRDVFGKPMQTYLIERGVPPALGAPAISSPTDDIEMLSVVERSPAPTPVAVPDNNSEAGEVAVGFVP